MIKHNFVHVGVHRLCIMLTIDSYIRCAYFFPHQIMIVTNI